MNLSLAARLLALDQLRQYRLAGRLGFRRMSIWGRIIGGAAGFATAGPESWALAGCAGGPCRDRSVEARRAGSANAADRRPPNGSLSPSPWCTRRQDGEGRRSSASRKSPPSNRFLKVPNRDEERRPGLPIWRGAILADSEPMPARSDVPETIRSLRNCWTVCFHRPPMAHEAEVDFIHRGGDFRFLPKPNFARSAKPIWARTRPTPIPCWASPEMSDLEISDRLAQAGA